MDEKCQGGAFRSPLLVSFSLRCLLASFFLCVVSASVKKKVPFHLCCCCCNPVGLAFQGAIQLSGVVFCVLAMGDDAMLP
jgi:hypothetical protein